MTSTTDTYEKLATPAKLAKELADEITFVEITEGTEKQVKYANDLRETFLSNVKAIQNDSNVRWSVIKQERGEKLTNLEVRDLALDAWNRRVIYIVNTNDAKKIIDHFVSNIAKKIDAITRYQHIISNPAKWIFDGKSWKQIFSK